MDRFEKHAEYIMKRGEKILAEKERRNKCIRRIAFRCSCGIAASIVCILAWKEFPSSKDIPSDNVMHESNSVITSINTQVTTEKNNAIVTTISSSAQKNHSTVTTTVDNKKSVSTALVSVANNETETVKTVSASTASQAVITTAQNNDIITTEPSVTTVAPPPEFVSEVFWGYNDSNENVDQSVNPMPVQNIAMKCKAFCASGEKLSVDVAMADASLGSVSYDNAGDYKYEVYICDPTDYRNIDDKNFIVNGERRRYKKEYSKGDVKSFDINGKLNDYDSYHHETTELDFSNYEVGSSGCIKFAFKVEFTDDPLHSSYMTANQYMYFYVGENGTFISNKDIEHPKDDTPPINGDKGNNYFDHGHHKKCNFEPMIG